MNIPAPNEIKGSIQAPIDDGQQATCRDDVRELSQGGHDAKIKLSALQAAITDGIESGEAGELVIDDVKKIARHLAQIS